MGRAGMPPLSVARPVRREWRVCHWAGEEVAGYETWLVPPLSEVVLRVGEPSGPVLDVAGATFGSLVGRTTKWPPLTFVTRRCSTSRGQVMEDLQQVDKCFRAESAVAHSVRSTAGTVIPAARSQPCR